MDLLTRQELFQNDNMLLVQGVLFSKETKELAHTFMVNFGKNVTSSEKRFRNSSCNKLSPLQSKTKPFFKLRG